MDISITFEITDVARYIAKYASKAEKSTENYNAIFNHLVFNDLQAADNLTRNANSLLMQSIGNNDVCAQQCAHIISGLPLYNCSRQIVLCSVDGECIQDNLRCHEPTGIRKHMWRPVPFEHSSFMEIFLTFFHASIRQCRNSPLEGIVKLLLELSLLISLTHAVQHLTYIACSI